MTGDTSFQLKKSSHSKKLAKQLKKEYEQDRDETQVKKEEPVDNVPIKKEEKPEVEDRIKVPYTLCHKANFEAKSKI